MTFVVQWRGYLRFISQEQVENALEMNAPLMKGYYLKEALREIWMQVDKEQAEKSPM